MNNIGNVARAPITANWKGVLKGTFPTIHFSTLRILISGL